MAVAGRRIRRLGWRALGLACGGRECRRAFGFARRSQGHDRASRGIRALSGISMKHQLRSLIVSIQLLVIPSSALTLLPKNTTRNKENAGEGKNIHSASKNISQTPSVPHYTSQFVSPNPPPENTHQQHSAP